MGESLTQQRRVCDEGLRVVKHCPEERTSGVRALVLTVPLKKALANSVPAAAVIRRVQALFGIIGRKGRLGGAIKSGVKSLGSTEDVHLKLVVLEYCRGQRNSRCRGEIRRYREEHQWQRRLPGQSTDTEARKRGEQTGLDTLVVHAVNDGY